MQVYELPEGDKAPEGSDRVSVEQDIDGNYQVNGVVARSKIGIFFAPTPYPTWDEALAAALAFGAKNGAEHLYLERHDAQRS